MTTMTTTSIPSQAQSDQVAVVIGRMQLPHKGHLSLIQEALRRAKRVIVVLGSAFRARDVINPFNEDERSAMVLAMLSPEDAQRVEFLPVRDYFDNDRWHQAVIRGVKELAPTAKKPILVSCRKDKPTAEYLDGFAGWEHVTVDPIPGLDATALRNVFFGSESLAGALAVLKPYVHPGVLGYLQAWSLMPVYTERCVDHQRIKGYHEKYPDGCYRTADALVRIGDHVLLVQRACEFGTGLWAIPGGFRDPGEMSYDAAVRELVEETRFPLSRQFLRSTLKGKENFEHPRRSPRGRLETTAYYFYAAGTTIGLPEVHAADGTKKAVWVHISELPKMERLFFEDHFCILDHFLNLYD